MQLQDLLITNGVDVKRTKLIRHNTSSDEIAENNKNNILEEYQKIQISTLFKNIDYVVSFLGEQGTEAKLIGCYKVEGYSKLLNNRPPSGVFFTKKLKDEHVKFNLTKTPILEEFTNRLVIEWGKGALSWCQNGTTEKDILYILPPVSPYEFISYDKILLDFKTLEEIIFNNKQHAVWEEKLSTVAGVYLITDTSTGKHYVGSATGKAGGIWQRWSEYAKTKHGGNTKLIKLLIDSPTQYLSFQYSILEVFPIKRSSEEVLEYEALYKRKLFSKEFGLNEN